VHLQARARERTFELEVVGSGTAVWVSYAIAEALRMLSDNAGVAFQSAKTKEFRSQLATFLPASKGETELLLYAEEGSKQGFSIDDLPARQHIQHADLRLQLKRQQLMIVD